MTISYEKIKLKNASAETVIDKLYEFDNTKADTADGKDDGIIDTLETAKVDRATLKELLCLDKANFKQSRYFVTSEGLVETFYAMTRNADDSRAVANLTGYEIHEREFIAPEDIGNAFKGEEFTAFINFYGSEYATKFTALKALLTPENTLAAGDVNMAVVNAEIASPEASLKKILKQLYKPAFIEANMAAIEELDLIHRYINQAIKLNSDNPSTYKVPGDIRSRDLNELVPASLRGTATAPSTTDSTTVAAKESAPVQLAQTPVTEPDLEIIREDISNIGRLFPKALPLVTADERLDTVETKWVFGKGKLITDQFGNTSIMGVEYPLTTDGVRRLHKYLWSRVKQEDPEKYYFASAGLSVHSAELVRDSGLINFPEGGTDLSQVTNNDRLDDAIAELKNADADALEYVKLIGIASATGEYVKDGSKTVKITSSNLNKYVDAATNELKSGFTWANGQPPTGTNKTTYAKKRHQALLTYMKSQGVPEAILAKATFVEEGGYYIPTAKLQFAYTENKNFTLKDKDFTGIPAEKSGAVVTLIGKVDTYLKECRILATRRDLSSGGKTREMIRSAVKVEEFLSGSTNFDAALAKDIARQLFEILDAQSGQVQGGEVLMQVLNATFHNGTLIADGAKPRGLVYPESVSAADREVAENAGVLGALNNPEIAASFGTTPTQASTPSAVKHSLPNVGNFSLNGGEVLLTTEFASQIAKITVWKGSKYPVTFRVEGSKVILTDLQSQAKKWAADYTAQKELEDPNFSHNGLGTYDLYVTFKDGSSRVKITGTATE